MITVEGKPVSFMYGEAPDNDLRFMSGYEDDEYIGNHAIYDVNTIASYDSGIILSLDVELRLVFEKVPDTKEFVLVED